MRYLGCLILAFICSTLHAAELQTPLVVMKESSATIQWTENPETGIGRFETCKKQVCKRVSKDMTSAERDVYLTNMKLLLVGIANTEFSFSDPRWPQFSNVGRLAFGGSMVAQSFVFSFKRGLKLTEHLSKFVGLSVTAAVAFSAVEYAVTYLVRSESRTLLEATDSNLPYMLTPQQNRMPFELSDWNYRRLVRFIELNNKLYKVNKF